MKQVLIIGAGRSSIFLIQYLLQWAEQSKAQIHVADMDISLAEKRIQQHPFGTAHKLNALNPDERTPLMKNMDLVVSMLPAHLHFDIVNHAIDLKIPVITPSYLSKEIDALHQKAEKNGVLVLNELGVDPGIDHMSAMAFLDEKRSQGAEFKGFESFTGGLIAPESDNNPWNYKFTWNPRNVVIAGQGGAVKFIQEGKYKYIPYHKLFRRTEIIDIPDYGKYEGYANRDSLKYRETYGLENIDTIYRGTLRKKGFCRAWDMFVQLGATDDSYVLEGSENMSYREFINSFLAYNLTDSVELKLKYYLNLRQDDDDLWEKLESLDIFSEEKKIGIANATPAMALQKILEDAWSLEPDDKDMIIMWHKFTYELKGRVFETTSSMVCIGENQQKTAMAKTVGLPLGIAARLILEGEFKLTGVGLPIHKEVYTPILKELAELGIRFKEEEREL
ncbi:saccharopine dehydrogenase family protein [Luteibaculum oceani]|uniref:Saccharopine dehydrogenase n=1 Tax=Luteibaculum oceani TaxID=1294296 RepID=A0A5C6VCY1_9FLAO|nr:saccharopine dehydrogenase family protein [Luteibaculum oceani]TXC81465.1 saccharopine dehydrogenase [Luteibaculum oceani]